MKDPVDDFCDLIIYDLISYNFISCNFVSYDLFFPFYFSSAMVPSS